MNGLFILKLKMKLLSLYNVYSGKNNIKMGWWQKLTKINVYGEGNLIEIKSKLCPGIRINVFGNNHRLLIEDGVIYKKGTVAFEDNECSITIKSGTTIEEAGISAAENNSRISIGNDCMLSSNIYIATTDSHSIVDVNTKERLNKPGDVIIGNHVWIGHRVTINKGVRIESNSVVAGNSVVTKSVLANSIVAGIPAKQIKSGIDWDRKRI